MKVKCDCGGEFKKEICKFEGLESEAMVCQECGYISLNKKQAEKLLDLKELRDLFRRSRRTIKIGNAIGMTLPKEFIHKEGRPIKILPLDSHTLRVSFG